MLILAWQCELQNDSDQFANLIFDSLPISSFSKVGEALSGTNNFNRNVLSPLFRIGTIVKFAIATICLFLSSSLAMAEDAKYGLKVGEEAPDFALKDQSGKVQKLSELVKEKNVAIVFYRSASWCPFCIKQLVELQAGLSEIEKTNTVLVGISYDSEKVLKNFASKRNVTFSLLSDPDSKTIKSYSQLNAKARQAIPHPSTYLVAKGGKISAVLHGTVRQRRPVNELLAEIEKIKTVKK